MDRTKKTIELPVSKIKVELYDYMTGGEKKEMAQGGDNSVKMQEIALKKLVTNLKPEDINNLHGKDYDFLLLAVMEVITDSSWDVKKKE